jgi:hypothetical protein
MSRFAELQLRIRHQHKDGSWEAMVRDRDHPGLAEYDPERAWARGQVFRCVSCPETMIVEPDDLPNHPA